LQEIECRFITRLGEQFPVGKIFVSQLALQCACTEAGDICGEFE
jgi:hypothetical protein